MSSSPARARPAPTRASASAAAGASRSAARRRGSCAARPRSRSAVSRRSRAPWPRARARAPTRACHPAGLAPRRARGRCPTPHSAIATAAPAPPRARTDSSEAALPRARRAARRRTASRWRPPGSGGAHRTTGRTGTGRLAQRLAAVGILRPQVPEQHDPQRPPRRPPRPALGCHERPDSAPLLTIRERTAVGDAKGIALGLDWHAHAGTSTGEVMLRRTVLRPVIRSKRRERFRTGRAKDFGHLHDAKHGDQGHHRPHDDRRPTHRPRVRVHSTHGLPPPDPERADGRRRGDAALPRAVARPAATDVPGARPPAAVARAGPR